MEAAVTRNPDKRLTSPREGNRRQAYEWNSLSFFLWSPNDLLKGNLRQFLANGPISCLPLGIVISLLQPLPSLSLHTAAVRLTLPRKDYVS